MWYKNLCKLNKWCRNSSDSGSEERPAPFLSAVKWLYLHMWTAGHPAKTLYNSFTVTRLRSGHNNYTAIILFIQTALYYLKLSETFFVKYLARLRWFISESLKLILMTSCLTNVNNVCRRYNNKSATPESADSRGSLSFQHFSSKLITILLSEVKYSLITLIHYNDDKFLTSEQRWRQKQPFNYL